MVAVGGAVGEEERGDGEAGRDHVDDGLERVGKDRGGAGEAVGLELDREQGERDQQRQRDRPPPHPIVARPARHGSHRHGLDDTRARIDLDHRVS